MSSAEIAALLRWYGTSRRRLPWRERPSPYRVWVSEIMLQQTQVATALPYYRRFLRRFPSLRALARASERDVLGHWAGLGYYARARSLRRAAREVLSRHRGRLPSDPDSLRGLPGIGRYTAAAVSSIAFGRHHALADGNVARVLSRFLLLEGRAGSARLDARVWEAAHEAMAAGRSMGSARFHPGDWNQSLMELGALVCLPQSPLCGDCPWIRRCAAFRAGKQETVPAPKRALAAVRVPMTALLVRRSEELLLTRRPGTERLLSGHWALPEPKQLPRARRGRLLGTVRHSITRHRIVLQVREGFLEDGPLPAGAIWVSRKRLDAFLVSSLWRKAVAFRQR